MIKLAPSILAADFANLERDIRKVINGGAHYIHIDVMDGHFVPNISIGPAVVKSLRKVDDIVFDVHLMLENPEGFIDEFANAGADIITIHVEAQGDIVKMIEKIKATGKKAGITLKPLTPFEAIFPVIEAVDLILVMSVEPGFGGQKLIPETLTKVEKLRQIVMERSLPAEIEIDGGVSLHNIDTILERGANVIVAGSSIFGAESVEGAVKEFLTHFRRFEE